MWIQALQNRRGNLRAHIRERITCILELELADNGDGRIHLLRRWRVECGSKCEGIFIVFVFCVRVHVCRADATRGLRSGDGRLVVGVDKSERVIRGNHSHRRLRLLAFDFLKFFIWISNTNHEWTTRNDFTSKIDSDVMIADFNPKKRARKSSRIGFKLQGQVEGHFARHANRHHHGFPATHYATRIRWLHEKCRAIGETQPLAAETVDDAIRRLQRAKAGHQAVATLFLAQAIGRNPQLVLNRHVQLEINCVSTVGIVDYLCINGTFVFVDQHCFNEITAKRSRITVLVRSLHQQRNRSRCRTITERIPTYRALVRVTRTSDDLQDSWPSVARTVADEGGDRVGSGRCDDRRERADRIHRNERNFDGSACVNGDTFAAKPVSVIPVQVA